MIKPIIIGNWKLNGNKKLIKKFFNSLNQFLVKYCHLCTVVIAPPILYAAFIQQMFSFEKMNFFLGAQNIDVHDYGPFTGEISPIMLNDMDIKYVIIGHSERRFNHKETNQIIAKKFQMIKEKNLIPILCLGDTEQERKTNKTKINIKTQIDMIFNICNTSAFNNAIIAYEPIWAIGSGNPASPKEAQSMAHFIRDYVTNKSNYKIKNFFVQYGGSVTIDNAKELMDKNDIDGLLVGGASLQFTEFKKIIETVNM